MAGGGLISVRRRTEVVNWSLEVECADEDWDWGRFVGDGDGDGDGSGGEGRLELRVDYAIVGGRRMGSWEKKRWWWKYSRGCGSGGKIGIRGRQYLFIGMSRALDSSPCLCEVSTCPSVRVRTARNNKNPTNPW